MKHASSMLDWDGAPLDDRVIVDLSIEWADESTTKHAGTPLEEAIRRASRREDGRRGIVIEGAPGAGKSVLSHRLEKQLQQRAFGELDVVIRRGARELAVALERGVEGPPQGGPSGSHQMVPLVDGIDELTTQQARAVVAWLEQVPGWWIATTRPLTGMRASLPRAWRLRIAPLSGEEGRRILEARGRRDLAAALFDSSHRRGTRELLALATRPLMIALLARVTPAGAPLHELRIHDVYERLLDGMLEQALQMGRLSDGAAERLRRLREAIVGELALEWLRAPSGSFDRTVIGSVLEHAGFRGVELVELAEALEFGHLLVPMSDGFDFAHRTIAEWAAAMAIRRRVSDRLRQREREMGRSLERYERASIEGEQLDLFLQERPLLRGRWEQLLRFYAPFVVEPLALLENIVGARARSVWPPRVREALEDWEIAGALVATATWTRPADARAVWGVAVRRWLLQDLPRSSRPHRRGDDGPEVVVELAAATSQHLPASLEQLIGLAVQTDEQRDALSADPLILLPALPAARAEALAKLLRTGDRQTQLAILEWHEARSAPVSTDVIDRLIRELPGELDSPHRDVVRNPQRLVDLQRLEELTWNAAVRAHTSLRGSAARRRMQEHPAHLDSAIRRWYARPAIDRSSWNSSDAEDDLTRRHLLAFTLGAGDDYRAGRLLQVLHPSRLDAVAGELFDALPPGEQVRDALVALMDRTGAVPAAAAEAVQTRRSAVAAVNRAESARELPQWQPEPAPVNPVITRFDDVEQDLRAIVAFALEIVGGDVHDIYSTPGPLGSEYDEPVDLDWHSTDQNANTVRAVVRAIDRALERKPESWRELHRLLAHPSQSLRLAAFERCAARSAPYDIIPLAVEALEQHARHDNTRLSGRWQGLLLAAHSSGGAGNIDVVVPDVWSKLARAVRSRITPAHRSLIESLAGHEIPWLRRLAAVWCCDLNHATWSAILEPLVSDAHAKVMRAALDGLGTLAPERIDACVFSADRSLWTAAHDAEIDVQRAWSPPTLIALIDEAINRCAVERRSVFDGCPSPVEKALQRTWTDSADLASAVLRWTAAPASRVRAACTRVGVSRGILPLAPLVPLLDCEDVAERVSALECITRAGAMNCAARVVEIWAELLSKKAWSPARLDLVGFDLEDRLLWALDGAPVELASLLTLIADQIPFDHEQMADEPRGTEIVTRVVAIVRRWGDPGVTRLLELIDDRHVEEHAGFCELVEAQAHRDPAFRSYLEARAATGKPASSRILDDIYREARERDLDGFLEMLRREVFPHDWTSLSARTPHAPPEDRQPTKTQTILFLAANPTDTDARALDREAREIQVALERSGHRDRFELVTRWAAQPLDLLEGLRKHKPTVVHFSGHGSQNGLFFQGVDGRAQLVSTAAFAETFGVAGESVQLVVLNACYSEGQAEALLPYVSCVVGMSGSIEADAARKFAIGLYGGIGECEPVEAVFKQGCVAIKLEGLPDDDRPQLRVRPGVDAARVVLTTAPR